MLFAIILLAPAAIASFPHEWPPGSCGNGVSKLSFLTVL
jgi:hypothetical protein